MFGKLLTPFTTAAGTGVAVRYLTTIIGAILAILGALGLLSPEQIEIITREVPGLLAALAGLYAAGMVVYATMTKSSSDKAAEVAKKVDAEIAPESPVVIRTPAGAPDIVVPAPK